MAALITTNFGGLVPKASARALPDNAAQTASNLISSTTEFRPTKDDATVILNTGITNPKTMYRLQRKADGTFNTDFTDNGTWKYGAIAMSFARGGQNNDITERTCYTYDDGSAPPRWYDALGNDRRLGVPRPTVAPEVVVTVVDEFTNEERAGGIETITIYLKNSTAGVIVPTWLGAARPGDATAGYADRDTIPGTDPEEGEQLRLFRLTSTGGANNGTLSDPYVGAAASFSWIFDAGLGGFFKTAAGSGWPAWAGTTADHWAIPFSAYGLCYTLNGAGLVAALEAIDMPGGAPGDKLMTAGEASDAAGLVADMFNQKYDAALPKIQALAAKVGQVHTLLNGGTAGAASASLAAFYASTPIVDIVDDAMANLCEAVWNQAQQAALHVDYSGGA